MAAIIQTDPYYTLIRKIGYSVGLEDLVNRIISLTELYVEKKGISYFDFNNLIENHFNRKNATNHFANFYGTLNLLKISGKNIHPLYNLDALSILFRYFKNNDAFNQALKIVLLQAVLEADGDIFLNALFSKFDQMVFKNLLISMINKKRSLIQNVFRTPQILNKIYNIVDIKTQSFNETASQIQKTTINTQSKFSPRQEPISISSKRIDPLSGSKTYEVNIPDDYLRKVPTTRRSWAEDLELFDKDVLTDKGRGLLKTLDEQIGLYIENCCFVFWPYIQDLQQLRIKPEQIDTLPLKSWDLLCSIAVGYGNCSLQKFSDNFNYIGTIDILRELFGLYQTANEGFGSIRHQLPLYVLEPCLIAISVIENNPVPPLHDIIDAESRKKVRKIQKTTIRGTAGALVFQKEL